MSYVKPLHLDVLGNQQSFGHFGQILSHPEYADLRETPDVLTPVRERPTSSWTTSIPRSARCCRSRGSMSAAMRPTGWAPGRRKELAASIGVGGVYVRHIRRIHDLLRDKHHKRMMMWGDIILQHPGNLAEVPKDTIMLTWGYDARASFEEPDHPRSPSRATSSSSVPA